jgi:hypothetical protein
MVKYGVLFEVRTELLNIIQMSFGFKGFVVVFDVHYWRSKSTFEILITLQK